MYNVNTRRISTKNKNIFLYFDREREREIDDWTGLGGQIVVDDDPWSA